MPENTAIDIVDTLLDTNWNTQGGTAPEPTFFTVNDGAQPIRFDLVSGDVVFIKPDGPTLKEDPIGTWVYGTQTARVLCEINTNVSRARAYNLMREIRRICHANMHDNALDPFQRLQFVSFVEVFDEQQLVWKGRVILELVANSILLNIST